MNSENIRLFEILEGASKHLEDDTVTIPCRFTFKWMDVAFSGSLTKANTDDVEVRLKALAGYLPFTSQNPLARESALELISSTVRTAGPKLDLGADNEITFESAALTSAPLTVTDLLKALAILLMTDGNLFRDARCVTV